MAKVSSLLSLATATVMTLASLVAAQTAVDLGPQVTSLVIEQGLAFGGQAFSAPDIYRGRATFECLTCDEFARIEMLARRYDAGEIEAAADGFANSCEDERCVMIRMQQSGSDFIRRQITNGDSYPDGLFITDLHIVGDTLLLVIVYGEDDSADILALFDDFSARLALPLTDRL